MRRARAAIAAVAAAALGLSLAIPTGAAADDSTVPPRKIVSGWLGYWASSSDVQRLIDQGQGIVSSVAIFWWAFDGPGNPLCTYDSDDIDGDLLTSDCITGGATPWENARLAAHRDALRAARIPVEATITDLSESQALQMSAYLGTPENRAAYAAQIADWAVKADVDGVDLDFENFAFDDGSSTWPVTRPRWIEFIKVLSAALHAVDKTLTATVPGGVTPFHSDGTPWDSAGYEVYAWSEIAPHVDRLRIMAYDYSWTVPGPIGPNDWAGRVVDSAVQQVGPANAWKIQIGDPQYGRSWVRFTYKDKLDGDGNPVLDKSGNPVQVKVYRAANIFIKDPVTGKYTNSGTLCPDSWQPNYPMSAVNLDVIRSIIAREEATPTWNAAYGEWWIRYAQVADGTNDGVDMSCMAFREMWWGDTDSALERASLVPIYRINGLAVWHLGAVEADFFPRLAAYAVTIAKKPTLVTVTVPRRITVGERVTITATATSDAGVAARADATLLWTRARTTTPIVVATGQTDLNGTATFTHRPKANGTYQVTVGGSWARLAGTSAAMPIQVSYAVIATARTLTPVLGRKVLISGAVLPVRGGTTVWLRRLTAGRWVTVATLTTDAAGAVATRFEVLKRRSLIRFVVPPTDLNARAKSDILRITARPA